MPKTFSFCIGRPWSNSETGSICTYAHGTEVQHGTLEFAKQLRDFIDTKTGEKHHIYQLVQIPE